LPDSWLLSKYPLYADQLEQMRERGFSRKNAMMLLTQYSSIVLQGEWLEEFWCSDCQSKYWYHVQYQGDCYVVKLAPYQLWQHASGVIDPNGNPSVGEFTRNTARRTEYESSGKGSMRWTG
jgi:hypothetical protein